MSREFFYNTYKRTWMSLDSSDSTIIERLKSPKLRKNTFVKIRNKDWRPGITVDYIYIPIEDIKLVVGNSRVYTVSNNSRTLFPLNLVVYGLGNISEDISYVVDLLDVMQREEAPYVDQEELENRNRTRFQNIFSKLTTEQKLYYSLEGDGKYL